MCRSIKRLRQDGYRMGKDEVEAAARQFVRKVTGFNKPSSANEEAFERAVAMISQATDELLGELTVSGIRLLHS